jgi:polyferredoxin
MDGLLPGNSMYQEAVSKWMRLRMRRIAFLLIQFFAGFGMFVVLQVAWLWMELPYWTKYQKGDVARVEFGTLTWVVTLTLFAFCQGVAYWGLRTPETP